MAGQNRSASRKQSGKIAFCGMMGRAFGCVDAYRRVNTDRNVLCADD